MRKAWLPRASREIEKLRRKLSDQGGVQEVSIFTPYAFGAIKEGANPDDLWRDGHFCNMRLPEGFRFPTYEELRQKLQEVMDQRGRPRGDQENRGDDGGKE